MKCVYNAQELLQERKAFTGRVVFVPTMGALHQGHLSLMERAKREGDHLIVSIFVNPTQFGPNEDFDAYPRTVEKDLELCREVGADLVFLPKADDIYPDKPLISVHVSKVSDLLCGKKRPGHFDGVVQVVSILFNMVRPDAAVFGAKDYQQLMIIRQFVREYHYPIEIIEGATMRESDGLAMSSRNRYLSEAEREEAPAIYRAMQHASRRAGEALFDRIALPATILAQEVKEEIISQIKGCRIDYVEILNEKTLENDEFINNNSHMFIAVFVGSTRLIDNLKLGEA